MHKMRTMERKEQKKIYNVQNRWTKLILFKGSLAKERNIGHPFYSRLERPSDEIGKQRPGRLSENKVPGRADVFPTVVGTELDKLRDEVQPELVGVGLRIALLHSQYGMKEDPALLLNSSTPVVSVLLAARIERADGVFKFARESPSRRRRSTTGPKLTELLSQTINNRVSTIQRTRRSARGTLRGPRVAR